MFIAISDPHFDDVEELGRWETAWALSAVNHDLRLNGKLPGSIRIWAGAPLTTWR
jgi:hypothetical protein